MVWKSGPTHKPDNQQAEHQGSRACLFFLVSAAISSFDKRGVTSTATLAVAVAVTSCLRSGLASHHGGFACSEPLLVHHGFHCHF
jgi:hypothetical protein